MKQFVWTVGLVLWSGLAGAQTRPEAPEIPEVPVSSRIDSERAKIAAERSRLEADFLAEDYACYQRFAVNSCLGKVNARRRQAVADLRRQEILLNDEERQTSGLDQLRRTEEKSSPGKLQEAGEQRAKSAEDYQSRLNREKIKQQERAAAPAAEAAAQKANAEKQVNQQKDHQLRADKQAAAAAEKAQYDARQKEAEARRAQHESELRSRPKSTAKTLPLPE